MSREAWSLFDNNKFYEADSVQFMLLLSPEFDNVKDVIKLKMDSDNTLFWNHHFGSRHSISEEKKIDKKFVNLGLTNTKAYFIHCARLGYYYCLNENFELADSLLLKAFQNLNVNLFSPREYLEIYSFRAAFFLSKAECLRASDFEWNDLEKITKDYLKEASRVIEEGLKLAKKSKNQDSIFYRYLQSMKERIEIRNKKIFVSTPYFNNESQFEITNNSQDDVSFKLKTYYETILKNIQYGNLIESLNALERLVQISLECRGANPMAEKLYVLISDIYLKLYNLNKSEYYVSQIYNMYREKDSIPSSALLLQIDRFDKIQLVQDSVNKYKYSNPLYAFENALMNQGSVKAKDARRGIEVGAAKYAIGNYLEKGRNKFYFNNLVNELAYTFGCHTNNKYDNFFPFNSYRINPYINIRSSLIHGLDLDDMIYYRDLRKYNSTIKEAKEIILNKIQSSSDYAEKSRFYHYLAKTFFYEGNIAEAVNAQLTHLNMELEISDNTYTDKVLNAQKTLSLLCMLGMWEALYLENIDQIENYQNLFINISEDFLSNVQNFIKKNFMNLDSKQQKILWATISDWFYNTIPFLGTSERAAHCVYNSSLFSNGLLLNASKGEIPLIKWQDVQSQLHENDLAIEFVNFRNHLGHEIYYAISISKGSKAPTINPIFSDFEFEALHLGREEYYENPQMNDLIFRPINISQEVRNIYFSPTGILNSIAIENLVDSLGKRACEKWNMYRLSSTRELTLHNSEIENSSQERDIVLFGDLDYDYNFEISDQLAKQSYVHTYERYRGGLRARNEPLKFSKQEIDSIAFMARFHNYRPQVFTGEDGTEESFKNKVNDSINILHLSTHGFYYSDEKIAEDHLETDKKYSFLFTEKNLDSEDLAMTRSALVLTGGNNIMRGVDIPFNREDGILTANEISKLSMRKCDLVALSACETALGKISKEGVFGLQRGFKIAGVQSILMSLWEVPDKGTCLLMQEFYKNLFNGVSKIKSLRMAQDVLKNNPQYADPSNWAGWILLDALN